VTNVRLDPDSIEADVHNLTVTYTYTYNFRGSGNRTETVQVTLERTDDGGFLIADAETP
jgi:hypothetical protein